MKNSLLYFSNRRILAHVFLFVVASEKRRAAALWLSVMDTLMPAQLVSTAHGVSRTARLRKQKFKIHTGRFFTVCERPDVFQVRPQGVQTQVAC